MQYRLVKENLLKGLILLWILQNKFIGKLELSVRIVAYLARVYGGNLRINPCNISINPNTPGIFYYDFPKTVLITSASSCLVGVYLVFIWYVGHQGTTKKTPG